MESGSNFSQIVNIEVVKILMNKLKFNKKTQAVILKEIDLSGKIMQRLDSITVTFDKYLPKDFSVTCQLISEVVPFNKKAESSGLFFALSALGTIVAKRVKFKEQVVPAMNVLKILTPYFSSEFSVRHISLKFPQEVEAYMVKCSKDKDPHVRRWSSEGLRPRLPWSFKLTRYIAQPELNYQILKNLASDESKYVQKSVANHINDICKDNPQKALELVKSFPVNKNSKWIINHGLRTLIKSGDQKVLKFLGYKKAKVTVKMTVDKLAIKSGSSLMVSLEIINQSSTPLIVDYGVIYPHGGVKVFKLTKLSSQETKALNKKIDFKNLQTRKLRLGQHTIFIQVNGVVLEKVIVELI